MNRVDADFTRELTGIVGEDRVRDDARECRRYSTDIGVMPRLVRPFVNSGTAGAVVRPRDEQDVSKIVQAAARRGIAVTPRGASTSGYGGVLPREGALVIDMSGLDHVLHIDIEDLEVTCQAGAIWEEVQYELEKSGLELRLYPSSYPSSTVGGWLAQGGSGFGSFEYGTFKENVTSARIVDASGNIHDLGPDEVRDTVADAEGITGIIVQVTFKVRPLEPTEVRLVSLPDVASLDRALRLIRDEETPIWSLTFLNPASVELKHRLPLRTCHEYEREELAELADLERGLPVSYLVLVAFPRSRSTVVDAVIDKITALGDAMLLSREEAELEWGERSNSMKLKRIGPSIIPTEVMVPLDELAQVLVEIDDKIRQPFVLEGMYGRGGNIVLLGYIPHDERTFAFNPAFALSLSVIAIARRHGGSAYSTGLYFRSQAPDLLGRDRLDQLKQVKREQDPRGILNPGKVLAYPDGKGGALDRLMGMASSLEGVIRPIANAAKPPVLGAGKMPEERNGVPGEVEYSALACARCGYCVHTCEQYTGRGWESHSPRGKYALIKDIHEGRDKWDHEATSTVMKCTTCERCDFRCQLQLPVQQSSMVLRGKLVEEHEQGTFPPFEMMAASLEGEGDIWAGKRGHRDAWLPEDVRSRLADSSEILYFAGCTASYVENDIAEATVRLLLDSGYNVTYMGNEEQCCGIPMKMAGKWELFEREHRRCPQAGREDHRHLLSGMRTCLEGDVP